VTECTLYCARIRVLLYFNTAEHGQCLTDEDNVCHSELNAVKYI
jgi:hypothetical protein